MIKRQKSFHNTASTLYLVATPIGNLQELTPRAIEILNQVDIIAAEDTRNTIKMLNYFDIKTKCISHHLHNEKESIKGILQLLEDGKDIALVSDAGYPLLSDPGQELVQRVIDEEYNVVPISGSSAALNALVASGICAQPFLFYGFLDASESKRMKALVELEDLPYTIIFYEAPHRIEKMLRSCLEILGNRKICLARELTKKYEEFLRGTIEEVLSVIDEVKGEMVVIVEAVEKEKAILPVPILKEKVDNYIERGFSSKEAIKKVAQEQGLSKNYLYREYHNLN
ncbi:16S rRNA (cytidine1402-2'-O)-methyltransferase [Breznakia sp. PF5-3]|uniref:16S rRNA (cytidine(1402)-2'-O)-methyltransferase n=1 Tax=unclassified Breznakia TaxID=2623764 RepID=UPI002407283E|nr:MULTISPECIES: 16S rRNA (cytidine(1402)-2'-O)-methyltransferase [unclassified Breznakia]MDL2276071.1 16S rRNA (cytidine(1402)-2'-O)-methyltransferase [Breznakia sp. OttesenSCG-928-G09]MDF9825099.1 16S rRNA (cytidine1402-2'-O)-methyltransferase [Breznakia sp. PM6-1]MDF9835924.1 16S rRNA (cytidine1402-2'-O)-methyltransferase [Breznakia sp. PF5-3]MDF9837474.1 16S rRNA (cytidine1402-2'-O)-methyltransferase [Breznakia sp. PFB2-8]MDF9859463.1 16S rRNA (cytidine1402-2'-O)-methyltransferase [Breznak